MSPFLSGGERDHLADRELPPTGWRPQRRPAGEDDQYLFVRGVGVVGKGRLAGRNLIEAEPELLSAGLPAELRPPIGEAGPLLVGVELGLEAVCDGIQVIAVRGNRDHDARAAIVDALPDRVRSTRCCASRG